MPKHWSETLSCSCGKTFRSVAAEARHRHNFPRWCKPAKLPAHIRVLRKLTEFERADKAATLTQQGVHVYFDADNSQTSAAVIKQLIYCAAISIQYQDGSYKIWGLSGFGRAIARRPALADEITMALYRHNRKFTLDQHDKIRYLK